MQGWVDAVAVCKAVAVQGWAAAVAAQWPVEWPVAVQLWVDAVAVSWLVDVQGWADAVALGWAVPAGSHPEWFAWLLAILLLSR